MMYVVAFSNLRRSDLLGLLGEPNSLWTLDVLLEIHIYNAGGLREEYKKLLHFS